MGQPTKAPASEGGRYKGEENSKWPILLERDRLFLFLALAEGFVEEDGSSGGGV